MTAWVFGFYCGRPGPLAAICFHPGPRKTMRWVQGLSSIVLSCSVTSASRVVQAEELGREVGGGGLERYMLLFLKTQLV